MPEVVVTVTTMKSLGACQCPRCKQWRNHENYDNLCNRCVSVLLDNYPEHPSSIKILEVKKIQEEYNEKEIA